MRSPLQVFDRRLEYPIRGPVENKHAAAVWLQRLIQEAISNTERRFGVYVNQTLVAESQHDCWRVRLNAHIWDEAMRPIEESESSAIG